MKTSQWLSITLATALNLGGWMATPSLAADTATPAHERFFQRIARKLNLSDDQKAQIKTVLSAEKDTLTTLFGQLHDARMDLRAAIRASSANETTVRAASAKVAAVQADLAVERMKIYGKIVPILADEQRRQIADFEQRADDFVDGVIARGGKRLGD